MSSTAVAETATSPSATHVPTPTKERTKLWDAGTIEIKIPERAKRASYNDGTVDLQFLQFARLVKGGIINIYVHGADDLMIGGKIVANAELWQKTLIDERSFFYIDLRPTEQGQKPTHHMFIMDGTSSDKSAFRTPAPLQGYVLFKTPDPKVTRKVENVQVPTASTAQPASTGDAQLDRLLADGWQIRHENEKAVYLTKDGKKPLTHYRPKKKAEKKK